MFTKSKIFLVLCVCFIVGVLIAPILAKLIMAIMAVIFVMVASIGWSNKYARLIGFAGLILLVGALRCQAVVSKNNLSKFYNKQAVISGIISEEPDIRADKIYLTLDHISIDNREVDDKILISVYTSRNFRYGDQVSVSGKILEPKVFPDFDYKHYLSRFGVDAVMYYPTVEVTAYNQGNKVKSTLLVVKQKFIGNLSNVLPEPQNAFLAGLLIGSKRSIPQNLTDAFNNTSTSHIIAISGYNITIIAFALDVLLRRFGKRVSFLVSFAAIVGFVIITGASASVIRAAVMGILALIALNIGRLFNMTNALVITAAVMILINPKILPYDVGFQLSFLALAGIVYVSPILSRMLQRVPNAIRETLSATLSAQIFTLPVLLYNFGTLSVVAPLTNILVLPLVPLTMLFGFLTGLVGFIWYPLSAVLSWPTWILLSYIIYIVEKTSELPYSHFNVHINFVAMMIWYCALIGILIYISLRQSRKNSLATVANPLYKPEEFR